MSEPPPPPITTNSTTTILPYHHHLPPHISTPSPSPSYMRDYRKGNWTLEETLVLINAKRLNDERCAKSGSPGAVVVDPSSPNTSRPIGELKWKWVENYCWDHGCYRSQNQCNDKWDNLLRDYKKVREYEIRSSQSDLISYWAMERQNRKDLGLPSNLLPQIYEPLSNVVQRRFFPHRPTITQLQPPPTPPPPAAAPVMQLPPPQLQQPIPPSPPPVVQQQQQQRQQQESVEESESSESETEGSEEEEEEEEEAADGNTKRRKVRGVGSSIIRGASILARCLESNEKKKERRHREVMELEERRIRMEEMGNQASLQAMTSMTAAVNNLSGAIQSLASHLPNQP